MATLVLTAAGSLLGPIGGAAGALLGQALDARLLKPRGRQGPRLQDLRVQASSYGVPVPQLFGTMRVAGTVIWSTDLIEQRSRQGGGKGRPSTTTYSYSASFAVALSSRPIRAVRRIWADGNLLRGAAGDWKHETGFRLHPGGEDQAADPLIASAEGAGGAPAYRGCAYAVFEMMALEPYGNRIPQLTFEVEADAGPVTVGDLIETLAEGVLDGTATAELQGYAAAADSLGGLIAEMRAALPLSVRDDGERLLLADDGGAPVVIDAAEIGEDVRRSRGALSDAPNGLTITHYDPARDHQLGVQGHAPAPARRVERLELPAALDADRARSLAEAALERRLRDRETLSIGCGWRRLGLTAGALVRLGDDPAVWRIERRTVDRAGVRLELRSHRPAALAARPADPGRSLAPRDEVHGPTRLLVLDLPALGDALPDGPTLQIAAAGQSPGWRRAALLVSLDRGASWEPIRGTAAPAVMGITEGALLPASPHLFDLGGRLVVALGHAGMALENADDARLLGGANLALVGRELIQFGAAEPLGGDRWCLSRLLRGRRGTEWALSGHIAGEPFVLIEREALVPYQAPLAAVGAQVRVLASGIGDANPVEAIADDVGEALRPPAPAHLTARPRDDGGFDISWVRRSRSGWAWGESDAPLGEAAERYRVSWRRADGAVRSVEATAPALPYEATAVQADRAVGGHVDISVAQLGTARASRPALLRLSI